MGSQTQRRVWGAGLLAWLLVIVPGAAQTVDTNTQAIQPGSEDALHAMSRMAAVIFAGQVIAIRRHEAVNGGSGVVEIDFAVDDAIRGVSAGPYTLREWGGLWVGGYEPFRVGERFLMLLHAPGAAGLSSPVGGSDGAIPLRGEGGPLAAGSVKAASTATSAAPDGRVVDLSWVATRATRAVMYRDEAIAHPASAPVAVRAYAANAEAGQVKISAPSTNEVSSAESAAYPTVVGMLRNWEKADYVAR
jgi:hypothetical protein